MKKTTRFTSILLALVMLLQTFSFAARVSDFEDFPNDWSTEAMTAAVNNGLLIGTSENTIEPKKNLTRAEMTAIVTRAFGATVPMDISFIKDVKGADWYYSPISVAYQMGVFNGTRDDAFEPNVSIKREEVFLALSRILLIESDDEATLNQFTDKADVDSWAKNAVTGMVEVGYLHGYGNGLLLPRGNINRAELAQIFHNIFKTYISEPGTYSEVASEGSVIIRAKDVTLENVTVNGDLIIADGVGDGDCKLNNVTVNGRILVRGGEGTVTFTNVTSTGKVIINDPNGVVNFHNYRDEAPFKDNLDERTQATFLERKPEEGGNTPSGGGGGGTVTPSKTITLNIGGVDIDVGTEGVPVSVSTSRNKIKRSSIETDRIKNKLFNKLPANERELYEFAGWYYDKDFTEPVPEEFEWSKGLNLYAKLIKRYLVNFYDADKTTLLVTVKAVDPDGNGGMIDISTVPAVPAEVDGKPFRGWSTDGTLENVVDLNILRVTQNNLKLYPVYSDSGMKVTVTFATDDNPNYASTEVWTGGYATAPADPEKIGHEFKGWSTDGTLENVVNLSAYPINADTTFKAVFVKCKYNVSFYDADGTTLLETIQVEYGEKITYTPNVPDIKDGKPFRGWSTDGTLACIVNLDVYVVTGDVAKLMPVYDNSNTRYDVVFMVEGTQYGPTQQVYGGGYATLPANPEKIGYTFAGWSVNGTVVDVTDYEINEPTTFEAVFNINYFSVKFLKADGNVFYVHSNVEYNGSVTPPPATPDAPDGKHFVGWSVDGINAVDFVTYKVTANVVFRPLFDTNKYNIEFYDADGALLDTKQFEHGSMITETPDVPTEKDGKPFRGWSTDGTLANIKDLNVYTVDGTITKLTAVYDNSDTQYDVVFMVEGAQYGTTQRVYGGGYATAPTDPEKTGYTFKGWSTDGTLANVVNLSTYSINANTTFTAVFEINKYTVKFIVNGAQYGEIQNVEYNGFADKPTDPTITEAGKYFVGWSVDNTNTVDVNAYRITENTTFTALIATRTYTVKFTVDGTQYGDTQRIEYGSSPVKPSDPTAPDGYRFAGWSVNGTDTVDVDTYSVTADTTFKAVFTELDSFTVIFKNGTDFFDIQSVTEGGKAVKPVDTPTKATDAEYTYEFKHWSLSEDGEAFDFNTPITATTVLYAVYTRTARDYAVRFYDPDRITLIGEGEYNYKYGDTVTPPAAPAKPENADDNRYTYTFSHWEDKDGNTVDFATYNVTGNADFYAVYDRADVLYTVIFVVDGAEYARKEVKYNTSTGLPDTEPVKEHTEFKGWFTEPDGQGSRYYGTELITTTPVTVYAYMRYIDITVNFYDPAKNPKLQKTIVVQYGDSIPESEFPEGYTYEGYFKNATLSSVYDGVDYTHEIDYRWFYDDNGEWTDFLPDVPVTADTDVYLMSKFAKLIVELDGFTLNLDIMVPYDDDTRIADTIKDAIFRNEGLITTAYNEVGVEDKILEKLRSKGLIDEESKEILNVDRTVKFVTVLGEKGLNKFIDEQLEGYFSGTSQETLEEFLTSYINGINNSNIDERSEAIKKLLDQMLVQQPEETKSLVRNAASSMIDRDISSFAEFIKQYVDNKIQTAAGKTEISELLEQGFRDYCTGNPDDFKAFLSEVIDEIIADNNEEMIDLIVDEAMELIKAGGFKTEIKAQLAVMDNAELKSLLEALAKADFELVKGKITNEFNNSDTFVDNLIEMAVGAKSATFDNKIVEYAKLALEGSPDLKEELKQQFLDKWNSFDETTQSEWIESYVSSLTNAELLDIVKNNASLITSEKLLAFIKDDKITISDEKVLDLVKSAITNGDISSAEIASLIRERKITVKTEIIDDIICEQFEEEWGFPLSKDDITDEMRAAAIDSITAEQVESYKTRVVSGLTYTDIAPYADEFIDGLMADDIDGIKDDLIGALTESDIAAIRSELPAILASDSEIREAAVNAYVDNSFADAGTTEQTIRDLLDTDEGRTLIAAVVAEYVVKPENAAKRAELADAVIAELEADEQLRVKAAGIYIDYVLADSEKKAELIDYAVNAISDDPDVLEVQAVNTAVRSAVKGAVTDGAANDDIIDSYVDTIVDDDDYYNIINIFVEADKSFRDGVIDKFIEKLDNLEGGKDIILDMVNRILDKMFADTENGIDIELVKITMKYLKDYNDPQFISDLASMVRDIDNILEFVESLGYDAVDEKLAEVKKFKQQVCTEDEFDVTPGNKFIMEPLLELFYKIDFDYVVDNYLATRLPEKVLNNLPLEVFKPIYERSRADYIRQTEEAIAAATNGEVGHISSGVRFMFNPVSELYIPLYEYAINGYGKLDDALVNRGDKFTDKYEQYVKANPYIDPLIDLLEPSNWLNGSAKEYTEKGSGYSFKEFSDYYQLVKTASVLLDDTFVWYCANVDIEDINNVLDKHEERILNYANLFVSLIEDYATNGLPDSVDEIIKDIMVNDMAKNDYDKIIGKLDEVTGKDIDEYIDKLAQNAYVDKAYDKAVDKLGARIAVILEKFVDSKLNRVYDENEFNKLKEVIGIIHADENSNITVDYVFDKVIDGDFKSVEYKKISAEISRIVE